MHPQSEALPIAPSSASTPVATGAEPPDPRHGAERIARLFRVSLRAGRVHPLQPMLQRYRAGANP